MKNDDEILDSELSRDWLFADKGNRIIPSVPPLRPVWPLTIMR